VGGKALVKKKRKKGEGNGGDSAIPGEKIFTLKEGEGKKAIRNILGDGPFREKKKRPLIREDQRGERGRKGFRPSERGEAAEGKKKRGRKRKGTRVEKKGGKKQGGNTLIEGEIPMGQGKGKDPWEKKKSSELWKKNRSRAERVLSKQGKGGLTKEKKPLGGRKEEKRGGLSER